FHCPGRYTLQIAEFSGRSTLDFAGAEKMDKMLGGQGEASKRSPLATAADDAEKLADALSKAPEIKQTGYQPYVYHDRTSSKVMIGAFGAPDDPAAAKLHDTLVRLA